MNREIKFEIMLRALENTPNLIKEGETLKLTNYVFDRKNGIAFWSIGLEWEILWTRQFTGLTDKTGKQCFEGDILDNLEVVKFSEGAFLTSIGALCLSINHREIVGNVYENPELL